MARVLYYRQQHAEAVPLFVVASNDASTFAAKERYDAACVALKAANTFQMSGQETANLKAAQLRRLALDWLEQELNNWREKLQSDRASY